MQCSEFCDGFALHKSLIANEGLLLHATTIQSRDLSYDFSLCAYPLVVGNNSKDSMIVETTCTNDINNREDLTKPFEAHSKLHKTFTCVVLCMQFMSMDQIEKQSHALFSDSNSKFSTYYCHNCCLMTFLTN